MTALSGSFVALKTMADGTCRVTIDLDCPIADFVALNGGPGSVWALARIIGPGTIPKVEEQAKPDPLGPIAKWAVMRCKEPLFWDFLSRLGGQPVDCETECKELLCAMAGVTSRRELDTNTLAAEYMRKEIMHRWGVSDINPYK